MGLLAPSSETGEEMGDTYYDGLYSKSLEYRGDYWMSRYHFIWAVIADRLRRDRISRILEIGCGSGQLAHLLMDQGVTTYTGLDFSTEAITLASARGLSGATFIRGDARASDVFGGCQYEAIVSTEVLEHIQDDLIVVSQFPPRVRCIFSVPNFSDPSHVRYFSTAEEVGSRYGRFFGALDILTLRAAHPTDRFFLCDGIRTGSGKLRDDSVVWFGVMGACWFAAARCGLRTLVLLPPFMRTFVMPLCLGFSEAQPAMLERR
jgi:SAM-dependent methyltransferase